MPSLTSNHKNDLNMDGGVTSNLEATAGPLTQALQIVDKKVRNLEKRKGKLDSYRADYQRGKELNDDQKAAIAKYDEVLQTLEFARELSNQFKSLAQEEEKSRKRQAKKEKVEKTRSEANKVASLLEVQDLLRNLSNAKVRSDFLAGENGALKVSSEQMKCLEDFAALAEPTRKGNESGTDFEKALNVSAEHLLSLVDGKTKKVGNTTYKELKSLLNSIKTCGYFDGKAIEDGDDDPPSRPDEEEEEEVIDEVSKVPVEASNGVTEKSSVVQQRQPVVPQPMGAGVSPRPVVEPQQQQRRPSHPTPAAPTEATLNFLQDSEIDMESPHMDPAVVVVHHTPPQQQTALGAGNIMTTISPMGIATQTYTNQMFIPPTTLAVIQQQQQHQMHLQQQQQEQQQLHQRQEPPAPSDQKRQMPAPGFNDMPQQQPEVMPPQQNVQAKPTAPRNEVVQDVPQHPKDMGTDDDKPKGYAAIAASKNMSSAPEQDTFSNISEWNDGAGNANAGSGGENRSGNQHFRGGRGGRGRGRGEFKGRGGGRGRDDRGGYRGGEGGYRSGDRDRGGYRGNGDRRGKFNNERRGGGERRGRGGGERRYGGNGGQSNGYSERS